MKLNTAFPILSLFFVSFVFSNPVPVPVNDAPAGQKQETPAVNKSGTDVAFGGVSFVVRTIYSL